MRKYVINAIMLLLLVSCIYAYDFPEPTAVWAMDSTNLGYDYTENGYNITNYGVTRDTVNVIWGDSSGLFSDDNLSAGVDPFSITTQSWAIGGWINTTDTTASAYLWGNLYASGTTNRDWYARMNNAGVDSDVIDFTMYNTADAAYHCYSNVADINDGDKHSIMLIYDATNTDMLIYIDGSLDKNCTSAPSAATATWDSNYPFLIGTIPKGGVDNYAGIMDEIVFYKGTIPTASNISYWHASGGWKNYTAAPINVTNVTVKASDIYNGSALSSFAVLWNGTQYNTSSGTVTLPIYTNTSQLWNVTVWSDYYFKNRSQDVNLSTEYTAGLYPWTHIYANDSASSPISNFSITWNSTEYNTTSGLVLLPLYNISNTNVSISTNGTFNDNSVLLSASPYLQNYTFTLYPDPSSVEVYIYEQGSGNPITANITLVVSGALFEQTYYINNGTGFIGNLSADSYTFKFSGTNYTTQTYTISVGTNTYQRLNAYLASATDDVIFTIVDYDSNRQLENASVAQQRIINSSWTTVSSKSSDITGRVQFEYVQDVKYRFIVALSGYETKTFTLDPVIFSSYTVRISRIINQEDDTNFAGITWSFPSDEFDNNQSYMLEFTIFSPDGALESYGFTSSYPNETKTTSGSNAYGSTLYQSVFINATSYQDTVNITFWYDTTQADNISYKMLYLINYNSTDGTFYSLSQTDYGLTTFEKVLIASICIVILGGFAFMFGGPLGGGVVSLFLMGWFYYIGFLTLWMVLPSVLVALVLIFWRSSS